MLDGLLLGAIIFLGGYLLGAVTVFGIQRYHDQERQAWGQAMGSMQQRLQDAERQMFPEEER